MTRRESSDLKCKMKFGCIIKEDDYKEFIKKIVEVKSIKDRTGIRLFIINNVKTVPIMTRTRIGKLF